MNRNEITNEQIEKAWGNANFGINNEHKRKYLLCAVMKSAMGYHNGHTIETIAKELGVIGNNLLPTKKGREFLRELYEELAFKP